MNTAILLLCLSLPCTPYSPDDVTTIPYQSKETTEIYGERHYQGIDSDLSLSYHYKTFDEILILPIEYQGESELYDLGFYVDLDYTIDSNWDANCYRIPYWFPDKLPALSNYTHTQIPEPSSIILFAMSLVLLTRSRHDGKRINSSVANVS